MKRFWVISVPILGVPGHEPSGGRVVVSGAQIVQAEVRVELFAAIEIVVGCCAGGDECVTESVIFVGVGHSARCVGQLPHVSAAVVTVETCGPDVRDRLVFANALQAIGVGALGNASAAQLFNDLGQPTPRVRGSSVCQKSEDVEHPLSERE